MKDHNNKTSTFLFPKRLIKEKHFSQKDVKSIKQNLMKSLSNIYLIGASVLFVLITALSIYMRISTNNHYVEKYGMVALVGQWFIVFGSFVSIILLVSSKFVKNKSKSALLVRIAGELLFVATATYMLCAIFSDAEKGFTTQTETLSASIIFVAVLVLIQPTYWIDAIILDIGTAGAIIAITSYCKAAYGMKATYYYGLIALVFPLCCYLVVALLFYAESQRYKEALENERLHNRAYYDSLTHCKNRYALNEFLKDNHNRWANKEGINLLIVLFDIDDFRLYNNEFSHLGGDYCLKSICDAIRREFDTPDLDFFRYGGEEFLLFFEINDPSKANEYLNKVRNSISNLDIPAPKGAPKNNVTISVGGLLLTNIKEFTFENEMKTVDGYLYIAKESGKDTICYNGMIINK